MPAPVALLLQLAPADRVSGLVRRIDALDRRGRLVMAHRGDEPGIDAPSRDLRDRGKQRGGRCRGARRERLDVVRLQHQRLTLVSRLSMIFSENRYPLFGIML